jgi:hypothetical protein
MRIVLIGPGNIERHSEYIGMCKSKVQEHIKKIALAIPINYELAFLPDKGICLEISKKFRERGGKVIGLVPFSDKFPGISHLKPYMKTKVNSEPLFSGFIDTGSWPETNQRIGLYGDALLQLGDSAGADAERDFSIYMYRVMQGMKQKVVQGRKTFHPETIAGSSFPYTILIYSPFMSRKTLSTAREKEAKHYNIKISYISSSSDLEKKLNQTTSKSRT